MNCIGVTWENNNLNTDKQRQKVKKLRFHITGHVFLHEKHAVIKEPIITLIVF